MTAATNAPGAPPDSELISMLDTATDLLSIVHNATSHVAAWPAGLTGLTISGAARVASTLAKGCHQVAADQRRPLAATMIIASLHHAVAALALLAVDGGVDPTTLGIEAAPLMPIPAGPPAPAFTGPATPPSLEVW